MKIKVAIREYSDSEGEQLDLGTHNLIEKDNLLGCRYVRNWQTNTILARSGSV